MGTLRPVLRLYLLGVYLTAACLIVYSAVAFLLPDQRPLSHLTVAVVFLFLTYIGERMAERVRADFFHSMSTVVLVAAVLVLPPPYPVLVALGASLLRELAYPLPFYKRLYNVAHAIIVVGGSSLAFAWAALPLPRWAPAHFLEHAPALVLLALIYAVLDLGGIQVVMVLSHDQDKDTNGTPLPSPTVLLLEGVSIGMGIVSGVAWAYNPAVFVLSLLPILTVRATFQTIEKDAARAEALRQRNERLEAVVQAGQRLRLQ